MYSCKLIKALSTFRNVCVYNWFVVNVVVAIFDDQKVFLKRWMHTLYTLGSKMIADISSLTCVPKSTENAAMPMAL